MPDGTIRRGSSLADVKATLGVPDILCEQGRDWFRYRIPGADTPDAWPDGVTTTFWYLDRHLEVTFARGRVRASVPVDWHTRAELLSVLRSHEREQEQRQGHNQPLQRTEPAGMVSATDGAPERGPGR